MLMLSRVADSAPGCASTFDTKAPSPMFQALDGGNCLLKVPVTDQVAMLALATLLGLGQVPLQPPNVSGWPSGQAWLSTASAQTRAAAAQRLVRAADLAVVADAAPAARTDALAHLLGLPSFTARTLTALQTAKGDPAALTAIGLVSPEYQVA